MIKKMKILIIYLFFTFCFAPVKALLIESLNLQVTNKNEFSVFVNIKSRVFSTDLNSKIIYSGKIEKNETKCFNFSKGRFISIRVWKNEQDYCKQDSGKAFVFVGATLNNSYSFGISDVIVPEKLIEKKKRISSNRLIRPSKRVEQPAPHIGSLPLQKKSSDKDIKVD